MKKRKDINYLILVLFAVYMVLVVWIILFKLTLSIHELDTVRSINLIPFYYDNEVGAVFHLKEVLQNVAIFIPFGIYLCMLKQEPKFIIKLTLILAVSSILEIFQYVLAVGRTDITDIITNTCGGVIGIGLYWLATKILHNERQTNIVITVIATIVTVVVVCGLIVLLILN